MISKKIDINLSGIRNVIINYLVPIVCTAAVLIILLFVLLPSYKALPSLKSDLAAKSSLDSSLSKKLSVLNKLVDYKNVVDENSNLVNKVLVSEELVPALLTQVDKIARDSGLSVTRLSYALSSVGSADSKDKTKDASSYSLVEVSMATIGSFEQLKTFLLSLENAARLINVQTLRYSVDDSDGTLIYSANFVLQSPYLFVQSSAVTDDPVELDITSNDFINLINKIKIFRYYDPNDINLNVPVVETPATEETTPSSSIFD